MTKLDQAIATIEQARKDSGPKQDLVAEAVMLTVQQVRDCDDMGLDELSQRMSKIARLNDLLEESEDGEARRPEPLSKRLVRLHARNKKA